MPETVFACYEENTSEIIDAYREMAEINLTIANICVFADEQQLKLYEEKLAESEEN